MNRNIKSGLKVVLAGVCVLLMCGLAQARETTVTLKDGKQITGDMVAEDESTVTLLISQIRTPIKREDIKEIVQTKSVDDEYQERKAKLSADKPDDWYQLAEWVYHAKNLDLAKTAAAEVITKFGKDPKAVNAVSSARLLIKLIDAELAKNAADASPTVTAPPIKPMETVAPTNPYNPRKAEPASKAGGNNRMSDEQINTLRLLLIDPADQPRVTIKREAIERLLVDYASDPAVPKGTDAQNAFRTAQGWQQLNLIFKLKARGFWSQVTVFDDPKVVSDFKTNVHRQYVLNYCGTALCHGGTGAGDLMFINIDPASNKTVYTNFYILNTYQNKDASLSLIDLSTSENSLLLQYALPRNLAVTAHPDVKGWKASFGSNYKTDKRYLDVLSWVSTIHAPGWSDSDLAMIGFKPSTGRTQGSSTQPASTDAVGSIPAAKPVAPTVPAAKPAPTAPPAAVAPPAKPASAAPAAPVK